MFSIWIFILMLQLNQGPARHFEFFQHHQVDKMLLKLAKCEVVRDDKLRLREKERC